MRKRDVLQNGVTIRCFRERSGLSQTQLAKLAGTAQNRLSHIEAEQASARLDTLMRIADALDVPVEALVRHRLHPGAVSAMAVTVQSDRAVAS